MDLDKLLLDRLSGTSSFMTARSLIETAQTVTIKGLVGGLVSMFLTLLFRQTRKTVLYISADKERAEEIKEEVESFLGGAAVFFFPDSILSRSGFDRLNQEEIRARLSALEALVSGANGLFVVQAPALLNELPAPGDFLSARICIACGDTVNFDEFVTDLAGLDFVREDRVEHAGEICIRGGIVDVFPRSAAHPVRVEFWDNVVESIRRFDPETQRSLDSIEMLSIFPQHIGPADRLKAGAHFSLRDYLGEETVVVLDEPDRIMRSVGAAVSANQGRDEVLPEPEPTWQAINHSLAKHKRVDFVGIGSQYENLVDFQSHTPEPFNGNLKKFHSFVKSLPAAGGQDLVVYTCDSDSQVSRISDIFSEEDISSPRLMIGKLALHKGFSFPEAGLVLYTDHEFFGRAKRLRLPKRSFKGLTPKQLMHLNLGDYVAHVDFGVGIYRGLMKVKVQGHERECLRIEYRDKDMVYVRIERMDRVNKYSPKEGAEPRLNKLGSPEWLRLKTRTKKKIKDIARDLIEIYATRRSQAGFAFNEDILWQRELEASFPYEDTPDQVAATAEVKQDMESPRPMDRLVCGDVGFGKTEIAVRAAFKSVLSGKQVALLVPTTILAYQHYNTFRERLENFPVQVEMLSRFRSRIEQRAIVEQVKSGKVDILIGTHRILSKDLSFHDLGLLIIDEEHRFGVTHKEKLKRFRATIDVLTLTATPIPRTLQFSLLGARDLTHINTPPKDRQPIITELLPFSKAHIREVILHELERGGQAFFVHNRVRSIERAARMVSDLVPEARVAVAHGQMPEKELEKIMVDFMSRKYDVLVSTMIIESGLDMPNVNTIVVNRADKLGLAQMHQLRGRVGRSHQRAFAYFIIPPLETLTDEAIKRLRAIEEFAEVGSGSQLAMRDLEIRGAGNLLGSEQTGFIDTLGFELYNKILDEAVHELKSEAFPETRARTEVDTQVEIPFDAYLPEEYVDSSTDRVDLYRRLTNARHPEEVDEIAFELDDRFGRVPQPVQNLLDFVAIRLIGKKIGLHTVSVSEEEVVAHYSPAVLESHGEQMQKWLGSIVANASQPFEFIQNESIGIRLKIRPDEEKCLSTVRTFLSSLTAVDLLAEVEG